MKKPTSREEEILEICKKIDKGTLTLFNPLLEQIVFLEKQLDYLITLPFIIVKKEDKTKQKVTPAYKQYKDLSQTYLNAMKTVNAMLGTDDKKEDSPLRKYMKLKMEKMKKNE